jgi:DoxX-like family
MNTFLWILQVILGIKLITVTYTHGLRQGMTTMQEAIPRLGKAARPLLYLAALGTLLGTLGLLLPGVTDLPRLITPISACGMAVMLLVSILLHLKSRDKPKIFVSLVLFAFAAFVAYGRWVLSPF